MKDHPARILVADDDPVSLQFLVTALRELGCEATGVIDGTEARAACERTPFDLMLLDRRMPDLGGAPLLRSLRRRGFTATAIATSAELDPTVRGELTDAGYIDAVTKPIGIEQLAALLSVHVPHRRSPFITAKPSAEADAASAATPSSALLEDTQALASVGGDRQTLQALRGLFAKELETVLPRLPAMPVGELRDWLHRLRASCRYCGATRLLDVAEELEAQVKQQMSGETELRVLAETIMATISALERT